MLQSKLGQWHESAWRQNQWLFLQDAGASCMSLVGRLGLQERCYHANGCNRRYGFSPCAEVPHFLFQAIFGHFHGSVSLIRLIDCHCFDGQAGAMNECDQVSTQTQTTQCGQILMGAASGSHKVGVLILEGVLQILNFVQHRQRSIYNWLEH